MGTFKDSGSELRDATGANHHVAMSDVAKKANVSIGTVSNYLNYPDRVSDHLKGKIQATIESLGFVHVTRRHTASRGSVTSLIGYVITDIENYLFTSIFEGAEEICEANGMQLIAVHSLQDKQRQSELVHMLCQMDVKGILISSINDSQDDIDFARSYGVKTVMVDHLNPLTAVDCCSVLKNDELGGEMAARELIAIGCKKLAFVGHISDFQPIRNRRKGIESVLNHNQDVSLDVIDSGGVLFQDGYEIGNSLIAMDENIRPDGVIAATDNIAVGIISAIADNGKLRIPNDISIIGMEGDRLEAAGSCPLSVVSSPGIDMGRMAMNQLIDEINNANGHIHSVQLLKPTLVLRESTRRIR